MATPNWIGATSGQPPLAAQVNQFLGTHVFQVIYTGVVTSQQATAGSGTVNSNGTYYAQSFTTGASTTAIGRLTLTMTTTLNPGPLTVQLQTNSAGAPSGTVLQTTIIPPGWANATPTAQSIPIPVTGLSASTEYWVVTQPAGDASNFYSFSKSNQTSGASTSTNGTTWTAQTYGLLYAVYDQTAGGAVKHTWEDGNARITAWTENTNGTVASLEEYTVAQGSQQFVYSYRGFTYAGNIFVSTS